MALPYDKYNDLGQRHFQSLIESVSVPGQPALAVVNPDGTNIGGGGGGGGTVNQGAPGASPWPILIDQTGSNNDVDILTLPLPPNAATETSLSALLAAFLARTNTLGQKTMAGSMPVVIASDQSTLPVNVTASVLPTGAATEATLNTLLKDATFTARINTLGQKTMAGSTPVVLASDQSPIQVSISGSSTVLTPSSGQVTIVAGQIALGVGQVDEVTIIANILNSATIALGPTGVTLANGALLEQGRDIKLRNVNLSQVFINGAAGNGVSWFATT